MAVTLEQLLYGIRKIESGGNYSIVNKIGAVGAYQVMKGNIPSWTKEALGYSMTWQQFRDSRSAQDAVARYKLGQYMKKYGTAESAAAMWFSGQPNPNSQKSDGANTVQQYVQKAMAASGGGTVGGAYSTGDGDLAASLGAPVEAKIDKFELAEKYGLTWATIKANSEIKKLFDQAVAGGWDTDLFTAKLKNTKWWRTTSDSVRKYFMLRTGDPATYKAKYAENAYKINQLAVEVGLGNQISKSGNYSAILHRAIGLSMRDGWSDARLKAYFGQRVGMHDGGMWGEAGEAYDQLFQLAYANGQEFSKSWYQSHIRALVSGKTTLQALETQTRNLAAAKYSAFADQIRAGHNAMDLAQPYIGAVAEILELPSTDIDLSNKWVAKAMTAKQTGSLAGTQYPLWQFANDLRADPLWKRTNNARESMFSIARQVAKDFGFSY